MGEGRLIGVSDWHPVARALDAARGRLSMGAVDVEALAAILDQSQPASPAFGQRAFTGEASGTQLYGLMLAWAVDPLLKFELSALARVSRSANRNVENLSGEVPVSRFDFARSNGGTLHGRSARLRRDAEPRHGGGRVSARDRAAVRIDRAATRPGPPSHVSIPRLTPT